MVDKLPAGIILYDKNLKITISKHYRGIPLGYYQDKDFYIYNHLQFRILLNKIDNNKFNVVGFNILPLSIKHKGMNPICAKDSKNYINNYNLSAQPLVEGKILFTYDVVFEYSDITLASRWDHYRASKSGIHWTGILITEILVIFTTLLIIYILNKNLNLDISSYNYKVSQFEDIEEYDWKQLSGDVFRPPRMNSLLLSSMLGTGTQLLSMFTITLLLGLFGFRNPEKRLNVINVGILLYCLSGIIGGYVSANFYRFWGGVSWLRVACLTSFLFPGIVIFGYIIVNIVLTIEKSNAAVHFSDILSLFVLWLFCTFPLILIGSFFGFKSNKISTPVTINKIPSIIPEKPWYLHYRYISFLTGIIGFATIFIELNYVMGALWRNQIYFLGAFLWIAFLLFIIVVGEMTVLVVFFNLCYGDYNWWWKSFIVGGSPVIYFILYSLVYSFYLRVTRLSAMVVYFGMMGLISAMAMLICGTVSVLFSLGFINKIYSKIRTD
jgi:transmembrane 9 superfamily protein 2/4